MVARPAVDRTKGSAGPLRGILLNCRSGNNKVPVNGGRRSHVILCFGPAVRDSLAEINSATITETVAGLACLGVQREKPTIQRAIEAESIGAARPAAAANSRLSL